MEQSSPADCPYIVRLKWPQKLVFIYFLVTNNYNFVVIRKEIASIVFNNWKL